MPKGTATSVWTSAQSIPFSNVVEKPTELVKIRGKFGHRRFIHRTDAGILVELPHRIRGVKDIRPYEEQHPVWEKTQTGAKRWSPVAALGLDFYAAKQLLHPSTTVKVVKP